MLSFQDVILRLQAYWVDQGAVLWQPYSEKVGAGTMNPATILRVLGPEPWNVVYIEPSYRPDDGRYAENPNRMQMHTQLQVILKPDPGDPQERYLKSLASLGITHTEHDIRFVEDNWESPALGAWGLGWEVWLDGQEITQFTYFQQAGGVTLDVPAVEITYGLERIVLYLQGKESVWDIQWDAQHSYGDIMRDQEIDHCRYDFDVASIDRLRKMYVLYEKEALLTLENQLVVPSLDYILRCSHTFNLLDARGTVGVTERSIFFKRMRDLTRQVAELYLQQREDKGFPWLTSVVDESIPQKQIALMHLPFGEFDACQHGGRLPFLLEIGVEELPATHLDSALTQLQIIVDEALSQLRLDYDSVHIWGTPRRLSVYIKDLAEYQTDDQMLIKGPPARAAFDQHGQPTKAAIGFARAQGVTVASLEVKHSEAGTYVYACKQIMGQKAVDVLADVIADWIAAITFQRSMRWNGQTRYEQAVNEPAVTEQAVTEQAVNEQAVNEQAVSFSRPIRWLVSMLGQQVIPVSYAGLESARITRGPRFTGSHDIALSSAADYQSIMNSYGIIVDVTERKQEIRRQARILAESIGGCIVEDPNLLNEVANLVEVPVAILGSFDKRYLTLPQDLLIAVMGKHQRYLPVCDSRGRLMAYFITIRNGGTENESVVRQGNEAVIRARYADAAYFFNQDLRAPLASYRKKLDTLVFQEKLGSMLDKSDRLVMLVSWIGDIFNLTSQEMMDVKRAAYLSKADLVTKMVVEMTSLQGIMGREYARKAGERTAVAQALVEQYLPRSSGDSLPESRPGVVLALADRLDTLAGLFAVGMNPTGSADPYGLRRAASGLILILLAQRQAFSIRDALRQTAHALPVTADKQSLDNANSFITTRLRGMLRDRGFAYDVVDAVLAYKGDDPYSAYVSVQQLTGWVAHEDWPILLQNYARCVRITRESPRYPDNPALLTDPTERALWLTVQNAQKLVTSTTDVDHFLKVLSTLVDLIDAFFIEVMVMVDDLPLRQARLALLQRIAELSMGIVDLSLLESF